MANPEVDSPALRLVESLRHELKSGKKDCQSEVIVLFKKIFGAIDENTDTPNVNRGLDDLAQEVHGLEAKLSLVTKERDHLVDTVQSLRAEIRDSIQYTLESSRKCS